VLGSNAAPERQRRLSLFDRNDRAQAAREAVTLVGQLNFQPVRRIVFTAIWIATVGSNIGTWMQNAASGWLMTEVKPDALDVALVQAASSLPMFLLALPAGVLADIVCRRRLQIAQLRCSAIPILSMQESSL
jgi:hypothetical protein